MTVYLCCNKRGGWGVGESRSIDLPCMAILAEGFASGSYGCWSLTNNGEEDVPPPKEDKPPYAVMSMKEVRSLPHNGLTVASLFSGCGGSCLGYRMAGFKVVYANEFAPHAQAIYRENMDPRCYLDTRDVREVTAESIREIVGGEVDVLDGSPPCQAFSTAGRREKNWGKARKYEHGATQKNEQLFEEYIRILRGLKPKAFVAENVSGLVKGTAKGFFIEIMRGLKESGYRVRCQILDAQWLGVPQTRQRAIFLGVREDLGFDPEFPKPLPYRYTVRDACPWIVSAGKDPKGKFSKKEGMADEPSATVVAMPGGHLWATGDKEVVSIEGTAIGREYDNVEVGHGSGKYFSLVRADPERPSPAILAAGGESAGIASVVHPHQKRKFTIEEVKRLCSFPDDFQMAGTFAERWRVLGNSVPPVMMRKIAAALAGQISGA